jgi:hypothetical protein
MAAGKGAHRGQIRLEIFAMNLKDQKPGFTAAGFHNPQR